METKRIKKKNLPVNTWKTSPVIRDFQERPTGVPIAIWNMKAGMLSATWWFKMVFLSILLFNQWIRYPYINKGTLWIFLILGLYQETKEESHYLCAANRIQTSVCKSCRKGGASVTPRLLLPLSGKTWAVLSLAGTLPWVRSCRNPAFPKEDSNTPFKEKKSEIGHNRGTKRNIPSTVLPLRKHWMEMIYPAESAEGKGSSEW